jgi:hypothetical protein
MALDNLGHSPCEARGGTNASGVVYFSYGLWTSGRPMANPLARVRESSRPITSSDQQELPAANKSKKKATLRSSGGFIKLPT